MGISLYTLTLLIMKYQYIKNACLNSSVWAHIYCEKKRTFLLFIFVIEVIEVFMCLGSQVLDSNIHKHIPIAVYN